MERWIAALLVAAAASAPTPLFAQRFESRSATQPGAKMDIVVREIERRTRSSVLEIDVRKVGSSVGSSFFLLCSIARLAEARGGYRYVAKLEETPARGRMLVAFLRSASEPAAEADAAFAAAGTNARVIDLEQFAPICAQMK